jgi:cellobiose-specific phosphotransferase system component IIA
MSKSTLQKVYPFIMEAISALSELEHPLDKLQDMDLKEIQTRIRDASNAIAEARVVLEEKDGFLNAD